MCQYSKENSSLEQNLYLHNQMYMVSIKIPQKGRKKNFKFLLKITKCESFQMLSPAIHLEGWGKYFEHEYIIRPSKNLLEY